MQNIQEIFDQIQALKKEQKELKKEYKDALLNANEYEETTNQLQELREKKKKIENITQQRMGKRWEQLEDNKKKIEDLSQMLTDIAMTTLMEGKTVEIKDEYNNAYEPVYKITFKKVQ